MIRDSRKQLDVNEVTSTEAAAEPIIHGSLAVNTATAIVDDEKPMTREQRRSKRKRAVRARTISIKRMTKRELELGRMLYPEGENERPRTRSECAGGARPCPYVSCHHHLYLDVNPRTGAIKVNFPDLEPDQLNESCALDIADRGGATLEEVGAIMNLTRERIRQLEVNAMAQIMALQETEALRDFVEEGPVGKRRLPVLNTARPAAAADESDADEDEDEDLDDDFDDAEEKPAQPSIDFDGEFEFADELERRSAVTPTPPHRVALSFCDHAAVARRAEHVSQHRAPTWFDQGQPLPLSATTRSHGSDKVPQLAVGIDATHASSDLTWYCAHAFAFAIDCAVVGHENTGNVIGVAVHSALSARSFNAATSFVHASSSVVVGPMSTPVLAASSSSPPHAINPTVASASAIADNRRTSGRGVSSGEE